MPYREILFVPPSVQNAEFRSVARFFYLKTSVTRIFDYLRTENRLRDIGHSLRYPSDSTDDVPHMRKTTAFSLCRD
jgi:hypothetical protein